MSVLIDAVGDYLSRSTGAIPNFNSTYTQMCWVYRINDLNQISLMFGVLNAGGTQYDAAATAADGTTLSAFTNAGSTSGSNLPANEWHHIALVRESQTSLKLYLDGVLDITNTVDVGTSRSHQLVLIGGTATLPLGGRYACFKEWTAALTIDEVKQEMRTIRPVRFANILTWNPMWPGSGERTRDYGSGLNLTENGTITDADPPPVSYGSGVLVVGQTTVAGGQTISPTGIASTASVGSHTLTGAATISPGGVASTSTIGDPTLTGAATISPNGIGSTATVGSHTVSGADTLSPSGIASTVSIGSHTLTGAAAISPNGVASTSSIGNPTLSPGGVTISPSGISSTTLVGNPSIAESGTAISPVGIPSTASVGTPWITLIESPECIRDWNIDNVVLTSSQVIIEQMTLPRSTGTPSGDHDWTI